MEVFERKIDAYGRERMAEDVKRLQTMNDHIKDECITKVVQPGADIKKTGLNSVYTFETDKTKPWCNPYTRRETDYCKMIRTHQTHKVEDMRLRGELPDLP